MCIFLIIFGFAMLWADRVYTDYRHDKKTEQEEAKQENNKLAKK